MNNYNYHSNLFFVVNNYFVYILNPQNTLTYNFYYNNDYFLQIFNKKNEPLIIYFKILNTNNNCFYYSIIKNKNNVIKLSNFNYLKFTNIHKDNIHINNYLIDFIQSKYPNLQLSLYNENLFNYDVTQYKSFLYYNWYYFGRHNKFQHFKYIIYKNKTLFNELYQKINFKLTYNNNKKYSLLFIDDRFDSIFEYILISFIYSINDEWNLNIYTTSEKNLNTKKY